MILSQEHAAKIEHAIAARQLMERAAGSDDLGKSTCRCTVSKSLCCWIGLIIFPQGVQRNAPRSSAASGRLAQLAHRRLLRLAGRERPPHRAACAR